LSDRSDPGAGRLAWVVGWTAAAVLGFEVAQLRVLLVASWHHFAFAVISVVLLGFGASGTLLHVLRPRLVRRPDLSLMWLALATAVTIPLAMIAAGRIPVEARVAPALVGRQLGAWGLYWAIVTVPILAGAMTIGLGLVVAGRHRVGGIYAANLAGSAFGALLTPAFMHLVSPAPLAASMGALAWAGALAVGPGKVRAGAAAACCAGVVLLVVLVPPSIRPDPFKRSADMTRLARQGAVERVATSMGPRAIIEAYRGAVLHDLPFLAGQTAPPPVTVLLADGHTAGSVLEAHSPEDAVVVDGLLMGLAHDLVDAGSDVAILGETGGQNVWLALRAGAASVEVVQPDAGIVHVVRDQLHDLGGSVLTREGVAVHVSETRPFLHRLDRRFDLIQLAALESTAAGSGGIGGLAENDLATVEGIAAALASLRPDGILAVTRGIQDPPRDNLKLLGTVIEALRRREVADPGTHLVVVRDFLGVCTLVRARPWTPAEIDDVRHYCDQRQLTPVWYTGVTEAELNRPDALPEPPDGVGDWYHYGIRRLLGPGADEFVDRWAFDIRPPTDDRPFFADFCRLRSLEVFREAYGDAWLTRLELAFLVVLLTAAVVGAAGVVAVLLPLPFIARRTPRGGRWAVVAYFGALGLGYLGLEMVVLARLRFLFGDPVWAAAVTIGGFLLFSGLGSLTMQWRGPPRPARLRWIIGLVVLGALVVPFLLRVVGPVAGGLPWGVRAALAAVILAPLAFCMGFPMPTGLGRLDLGSPALVPWAWAANGFASVVAAPLTVAIAMSWSYQAAAILAAAAYVVAGAVFGMLPQRTDGAREVAEPA
jgi:hypothetical protein